MGAPGLSDPNTRFHCNWRSLFGQRQVGYTHVALCRSTDFWEQGATVQCQNDYVDTPVRIDNHNRVYLDGHERVICEDAKGTYLEVSMDTVESGHMVHAVHFVGMLLP